MSIRLRTAVTERTDPGASFTWRYDSGEVAGAVATLFSPITSCAGGNAPATLVRIPAPGTENDDTNPPRVAPRNLFDAAIGDDDLFHTDHVRYRVALYNFLSTFSGTHFVRPRSYTAEFGIVW